MVVINSQLAWLGVWAAVLKHRSAATDVSRHCFCILFLALVIYC